MNLINQTAKLMNELSALQDDSRQAEAFGGLLTLTISSEVSYALLGIPTFLQSFTGYRVEFNPSVENPYYTLTKEVRGIDFQALLSPQSLEHLQQSHPEHYEYISQVSVC